MSNEAKSLLRQSPRLQNLRDIDEIQRDDPLLIEIIEKLGKKGSIFQSIEIIEIPDDVKDWYIEDYDGVEWVAEGRTWCSESD